MQLNEMWADDPSGIRAKKLRQIVAWAGDGNILNAITSHELRSFFSLIPEDLLESYVDQCLNGEKIENKMGGFVLQDLINEIGNRLGYSVTHGRYKGKKGENGFDGLWAAPDGSSIIMESKTTDTYSLNLDGIANYRNQLIKSDKVDQDTCTVLIVAGRYDIGDSKSQVRGSRHAYLMNVISTDSLIRLLHETESPNYNLAKHRIMDILRTQDFTDLDKVVQMAFPNEINNHPAQVANTNLLSAQASHSNQMPQLPDPSLKVGEFIKKAMQNLSDINFEFTQEEIELGCSKEWSNNTFGISWPFFRQCEDGKKTSTKDENGYTRFWATPLKFGTKELLISKEWYPKNKERFIGWYSSLK